MTLTNSRKNDFNKYLVFPGERFAAGTRCRWTGRILAIGRGYTPGDAVTNFINLNMPPVGTAVEHSTGGTRATTADGFDVRDWEVLYYRTVPEAGGTVNDDTKWFTVAYNDDYQPSDIDLIIVQKVGDASNKWRWGDGQYTPTPAPPDTTQDFWRSTRDDDLPGIGGGDAGQLPQDATGNNWQREISHQGNVGIGALQRITGADTNSWRTPVATLDVQRWNALRTGVDHRTATDPLYVTGTLQPGRDFNAAAGSDPMNMGSGKAFIGHENQTQGWVLGYDTIGHYSSGASGALTKFWTGHTFRQIHKGFTGNQTYEDLAVNQTMTAGQVMNKRWLDRGRVIATERMVEAAADRFEWRWQVRVSGAERLHMRIIPTETTGTATTLFFENNLNDDKISLWGGPGSNANARYSFGIRGNTLLYKAPLAAMHAFNFGGAATNQIEIRDNGDVRIFNLPVAANNAAAPGPVGRLYRSNNGVLNVKF